MTAFLEISSEAAAFLGPETLARASDPLAVPAYTCPVCDQAGSLADPASPAALIVWHYLPARTARIRYAWSPCTFVDNSNYAALSSRLSNAVS
jgi:hypothetical protein